MSNELAIKQETTHLIVSINKESPANLPFVISDKENELTVATTLNCPLIVNLPTQKKEILKSIRTLILYTAKQFKWSKDMEVQEASVIALDLYDRFKTETIEDITLMFAKARKGELKDRITQNPIKLNGRIDNETIFNIIVPAYLDLKSQERENAYIKKKNQKEAGNVELTEGQKKQLTNLKKVMLKKIRTPESKPVKKQLSPVNELCQEHFREYDRLKRYEPDKIPKRITSSYDYLKFQFSKMKHQNKPLTNGTVQKWAKEFWELRDQDKLPDGIDTYSKYFEFKSF